MVQSTLNGVFTALVTPFTDNAVDFDTFRRLCRRQIDSGISGLVPCGTTGETPSLSNDEWQKLIQIAVEESAGDIPVIAGCGTNSTQSTVENVRQAQQLGADAALVVFSYYNKPNPQGHQAHVNAICSVGLPIVLYHVPGRTGQRLSADLLETLCRTPGVIGIKEATGDVALGLELCNRLADTTVSLLSGDDFTFAPLLTHGFDGVISVLSNPAPAYTVAWAQDSIEGKKEALVLHRQYLLPIVDFLFSHSNPLPCKVLMHHMGLLDNETRLPLLALEEEDYELPNGWERLG